MRGYQKRIICLKHTGSHLFEEAYFIVSPSSVNIKDSDMVEEANRIINDSIGIKYKRKKDSHGFLYPFLLGSAVSVIIFSAVLFFIFIF